MSIFEKTRNWYGRYERPISSLSLISGFIFDAITLKRIDTLWENVWIILHIFIVGLFIALIHIQENDKGDEKNPIKKHFWYVNILQFFFGGLISTFLVFYFRSSDLFTTWPFILILVAAFVANESLKRHYMRFSFQISLFFISIYSFFIFVIPVILHKIGTMVFLLSGALSLIFIAIFIAILLYFIKEEFRESKKLILSLIIGISLLVNFLYFTNLIPPIPLSLKDAGVFYSIQKNENGNYDAIQEKYGWKNYFKFYKDFKKISTYPVYVYSAIFSPTDLDITVLHEWQYYNAINKKWITETIINLPIKGGRDDGFRTYSMRYNLREGKWRVNIKTELGQTIGRLRFEILPTNILPEILNITK